jgi:hypothetical protein
LKHLSRHIAPRRSTRETRSSQTRWQGAIESLDDPTLRAQLKAQLDRVTRARWRAEAAERQHQSALAKARAEADRRQRQYEKDLAHMYPGLTLEEAEVAWAEQMKLNEQYSREREEERQREEAYWAKRAEQDRAVVEMDARREKAERQRRPRFQPARSFNHERDQLLPGPRRSTRGLVPYTLW